MAEEMVQIMEHQQVIQELQTLVVVEVEDQQAQLVVPVVPAS